MGRHLALRVGALASVALFGCGDSATAPVETQLPVIPPPAHAISDAVNAGNPHVYFLPPVVPDPTPTGTFDASLSPRVEICESDLSGCVDEPFAVFTSGSAVDQVRVVPEDEHYLLNWDTGDWGLATDAYYRITVFQASFELGYVDVRVDGKGGGSNPGTGETFSLKDGRTLPLKVRIEEGAAAMAPASVSTPDGSATVQAPPGALQQYEQLTVESVDPTTTELPDDGSALPGSVYDFGPDGLEFQEPVELALAYDPVTLPAGVIESELRVYVAGPGGWELLPGGSVDLATNRVTGLTTHFSVFAILPGKVKKCQSGGYGTLQEALADVGPGGTITACDGTHSVEGVVVDKPVTIQAEVGATPVFETTTERAALVIDGIASGTVVLDGLAFDYSTPHPLPDGTNAYAVQAENEYDQVVILNSTFTIDAGSRGAIVANASSVPTAALFVDDIQVSGGAFGIAVLDIHAEVTNSLFTANSIIGVQFASSSATADGLLQGSTFVDCGTFCARGWGTQPMDIVGNTFGQCGSARCIGTTNGAQVNVTGNTFVQQVLTGDPAPDPNNQIFVSASSTVTVTGNTFNGCAFFNCVEVAGVATISDNDFHHNTGQPEWDFSTIVGAFESIDATLDGNRLHSCGVFCYNVGNGANVTIRNETVTSLPGHGTDAIVTMHVFDDPAAPANDVVFEDNVITGSGTEAGVTVWDTDLTLNGNVFTQVAGGLEVGTGLTHVTTVTGRDNVFTSSGTAVAVHGSTTVDFRFNDITGQAIDIGAAGDGTSNLTCNWWGTVDGPANTSGAPEPLYAPWALASIAGTGASDCTTVRVATADDGSQLPYFPTVGEAVARAPADGTVLVSDGTYSVEGVVVDEPVMIQADVGATPVFVTTTARAALVIDGIASGTVVLDGLAFDFDTPTPDPNGLTTYAILATGAHDRIEIRNTTFDVDPGARGAINVQASTVASQFVSVDQVTITGGQFGLAIQDVRGEILNSVITGPSIFAASISNSTMLVQGNTIDCGIRCIRPISGSDVDVIANDFGACGSERCISVGGGSHVDVLDNTFAAPVLTGDSGPDQNQIILVTQGSSGSIENNVFAGCGFFDCVQVSGAGSSATITNNEFTHVAGQSEWIASDIILSNRGATVVSEENTLHSCGVMCYKILDGATATIRNETIAVPAGHGTTEIVFAGEDDPASGPNAITFEDNVVTGGGTARAVTAVSETALTVQRNGYTGLLDGILLGGAGSTLTGRDNVLTVSGTAIEIVDGFADFRFNDITGQSIDIGAAGDATSNLTCNWWGSVAGPTVVSGAPPAVHTPWALAPIAGTAAAGCAGGS